MSRDLPIGFLALVSAQKVAPVFLVELDWPGGTMLLWNGYYTLRWDGVDWLPLGHLGGIAEIKESSDLGANGVQLSLSGIPTALIASALANDSQGRAARIYFGVISPGGFTVDPYCIFDGMIDYCSIVINGDTSSISVFLEKEFIDNRSNARRWNHQDQQIDYPGDLGFEFVAALSNKQFTWGKATQFASGGPAEGSGGEFSGGDPGYLDRVLRSGEH